MIEIRERKLPGIINVPLRWLHRRWSEEWYGFPEGRITRNRMEDLMKQERLGLYGVRELLDLISETPVGMLQLRMSKKIREGVDQLIDGQRLPQMDTRALTDYMSEMSREEGLD